jgi:hypothetical protein
MKSIGFKTDAFFIGGHFFRTLRSQCDHFSPFSFITHKNKKYAAILSGFTQKRFPFLFPKGYSRERMSSILA